jgi:integrase/recombinase XerD
LSILISPLKTGRNFVALRYQSAARRVDPPENFGLDSQRIKGRKDRDLMLSPKLLKELREHWHRLRRKPSEWLFPGNRNHTSDKPISTKVVWHACRNAAKRSGIQKRLHPHTLSKASA